MCLIVAKPAGQDFNMEHLEMAFYNNPDGAGVMFQTKAGVTIERGFWTWDALADYLESQPLRHTNVVVHFRWATHGQLSVRNCHPMPVWGKVTNAARITCKMGIVHNGIIMDVDTDDTRSDTVAFIEDYLSKLGKRILQKDVQSLILLATHSKFAILTQTELHLLGHFDTVDGLHYSNDSYLPMKTYAKGKAGAKDYECQVCGDPVTYDKLTCAQCPAWWDTEEEILVGEIRAEEEMEAQSPTYLDETLNALEDEEFEDEQGMLETALTSGSARAIIARAKTAGVWS